MTGGRHCPFLNREDPRCAEHFGVNRLQHAFDHCVGQYDQCPAYHQLLDERNRMRAEADVAPTPMRIAGQIVVTVPLTLRGRDVPVSFNGKLAAPLSGRLARLSPPRYEYRSATLGAA